MIFRDYQRRCIDSVFEEWNSGAFSTLGVAATGIGKTIIFAGVADRMIRNHFPRKVKVMVLADKRELIFQAADKITKATGRSCEIEMGDYRAMGSDLLGSNLIVVSSIQTHCSGSDGGGRMGKFDPNEFVLLIIDEADGAVSKSYRRVIDYYKTNPKLKILGVTATPDRTDEQALGQIFETVAFQYELLQAIADGWLVEPIPHNVDILGLDYSGVSTTAGDLNGPELANVLENEKTLQGMAGSSIDIIGEKRSLYFAPSVPCAETFCEILNRHRKGMAAWVCGKTHEDDRKRINEDFHSGKLQVLCNFNTHSVGFDCPGIEAVILGRPTKSRRMFAQWVGRGTRPLPGIVESLQTAAERVAAIAASAKSSVDVIDFVGNSGRHKLVNLGDILGGNVSDEAIERVMQKVREGGSQRIMQLLTDEEEKLRQEQAVEREKKRLKDEARRIRLVAKVDYSMNRVDPFDVLQMQPAKERGWNMGKQLSEPQKNILRGQGIDPDSRPYGEMKQILNELFRRWNSGDCTFGQMKILKERGLPTNITKAEATKIIDGIAIKEGWKKKAA